MNKTTAEIMDMQQKGLIPADEAIQTIIEGMNKRFPRHDEKYGKYLGRRYLYY